MNSNSYPGVAAETFGVGLGDIDDDGDLDAVIIDAYDDMEVYTNDGTGFFTYSNTYSAVESWFGAYLVDVDDDQDSDIVVSAFYSSTGCEVWKNDGNGNFTFSQDGIETNETEAIMIYPNPVKDFLHIHFPGAAGRKIILQSIDGKYLYEKMTFNELEKIDMNKYDQGIYTLIIEANGESVKTKVVKR